MIEKIYKTVLLPIQVPDGDWCMETKEPFRICEHLDVGSGYIGGSPRCSIGIGNIQYKNNAIHKPIECMSLAQEVVDIYYER